MNWEAAGALGEIVGATAVVATLIYLAIQTKRTREAVVESGTISTLEMYSRWRGAFSQSPDLARIATKANDGEVLEPEEQLKFSLFADELLFTCAVSYATSLSSGSLHESEAEIDYVIGLFELIPALAVEWKRAYDPLKGVSPELVDAIDRYLLAKKDDV